jgi:hypothetical protein
MRKFTVLTCAAAMACAFSIASAPAYSVPLAPVKAGGTITLAKKDGDGKNWNHNGDYKNWNKNGGSWSNKGDNKHWSGKGHGGKKWSNYGNWHRGDHHRGGYWRNGIFVALPLIIGEQCYDYLDWRDGVPRPGWYWVC